MSPDHYDSLETRDPDAREAELFAALRDHLGAAMRAPSIARLLAGVDPDAVTDRAALAALPVIRKSELMALQAESPPLGGLTPNPAEDYANIFASPGPIFEPAPRRDDPFRMARALFAAGLRSGDLVHNTFSYHFTPAGAMLEGGARAIGCTVFPAGVGQTELQVQAIARLRPNAYVGTPSFLNILLDKAAELGEDVRSLEKGLVTGEALPPSLRKAIGERGVSVLQCYAVADVGLIAYESPALEGMILDEGVILEIVRPGTGDPVAEGEVGEIVVDATESRLPAGALRDRRSLRGHAGREPLRAHEHPNQGVDGTRRPDDEGQGDVRASVSGRRGRAAARGDRPGETRGHERRQPRTS